MDSILYYAITTYYDVLGKLGYYNYNSVFKVLLLCFYRDFIFKDYSDIISRNDYMYIEKALNCLYGSDCLIPYPDYISIKSNTSNLLDDSILGSRDLQLNATSELIARIEALEDTEVVKSINGTDPYSDVIITVGE